MENSDILSFLKIKLEDYKKDSHSKSMSEAETKDKDPGWRIWDPPKKVIDIAKKEQLISALYTIVLTLKYDEYDKYQEEGNKRKINFTPHSMYKANFKIETAFTQDMVSGYFFKYKNGSKLSNAEIGKKILKILANYLGKDINNIDNEKSKLEEKIEAVNANDEYTSKVQNFLTKISETVKKIEELWREELWREELWREDMKNSEQEIKDKVKNAIETHNQVIFTGAPGTGKTYTVKKKVQELIKEDNERVKFVQFHPSYDYTDFVEGLRPVILKTEGEPTFVRLDGTFKEFCRTIVKNNVENSEFSDNKGSLFSEYLYLNKRF